MGYVDEYGEWQESEPFTEPVKPALWTKVNPPKKSQASISGKHTLTSKEQRRGARKGGISRASKLTPERRKEIAQNAAKARWQ